MEMEAFSLLVLSLIAGAYILFIRLLGVIPSTSFFNVEIFKTKPDIREGFFDLAKGLAIIAVVVIHAVLLLNYFSDDLSVDYLAWSEHINRLVRFAIPVFFICSGALLFLEDTGKTSLKRFYFPKVKRLVIPYVIFSVFATFAFSQEPGGFADRTIQALSDLFTGGALAPYWFIPVLFQLYLLYPILWYILVVKKMDSAKFLAGSFVISLLSYFLFTSYWFNLHGYMGDLVFFGPYLFFFAFGMVFKPLFFSGAERVRDWMSETGFLYFASVILFVYFLIGAIDPLTHYYNVRLIYGPTMILIILYIYPLLKNGKIGTLIERVGAQSLYIYLLHFILLLAMSPFVEAILIEGVDPFITLILVIVINLSMTCGAIYLARKMIEAAGIKTAK